MNNRTKRANIAQETLNILERGTYQNSGGREISIANSLSRSIECTEALTPEMLGTFKFNRIEPELKTTFSVENTTSLAAARALKDKQEKVLCLNFASAKNPGGGFLGGSQAQEESLARASALYATLIRKGEIYYATNRKCGTCLYTDHMIYSPNVPVFRDDQDELLEDYWECSFVTAPAVNYGALKEHEKAETETIMRRRIDYVLALAAVKGYRKLILGAWGCGVFRNDPALIAQLFKEALRPKSPFSEQFEHICFAVLDSTAEGRIIKPFRDLLGS